MNIISKYAARFFTFDEYKLLHITSFKNAKNIINSQEVWVHKKEFLNDNTEQKSFRKIIGYKDLLNDELNNKYISFSLTSYPVKKETLIKYGEGYSNSIVFEYDKFSLESLIYSSMVFNIK